MSTCTCRLFSAHEDSVVQRGAPDGVGKKVGRDRVLNRQGWERKKGERESQIIRVDSMSAFISRLQSTVKCSQYVEGGMMVFSSFGGGKLLPIIIYSLTIQ